MNRFEDRVVPEPNTGCWIPLVTTATRRHVYLAHGLPIPEGRVLYASCGTGWCVNPEHATPRPFNHHIHSHIHSKPRPTAAELKERFDQRVRRTDNTGCWMWTGAKTVAGYGILCTGRRQRIYAHRFAVETFRGQIPDGFDVDHLCRNPGCVNPEHLEAVTHIENVRRGTTAAVARARHASRTHCKHGHAFTSENTVMKPYRHGTYRHCLACARGRGRARTAAEILIEPT